MRRFTHLATSLCLILGLAAVGCDDDDDNNDDGRTTFAVASMTGANEVPPNASTAQGSASFDLAGGTVTYSIQLQGITDVIAAHIHLGAAGGNGPVVVNLFTGPTTGPVDGILVQSTFSAADVDSSTSFESLIEQMRNRGAYVNVHTTAFPDGEVRGQIEVVEP
jgi:hypothetical protein